MYGGLQLEQVYSPPASSRTRGFPVVFRDSMFVFQVPSNPVPASAAAGSSSVGNRSLIASHLYPLFCLAEPRGRPRAANGISAWHEALMLRHRTVCVLEVTPSVHFWETNRYPLNARFWPAIRRA